ncbi:MAG: hypothetical protein GWP62_12335 [Gammaproteobacteria bacterium]|jgi:hypothetical protein|nr:hypothetical protein [Gammaproteobacteria bacterium]
MRKPIPQIFTSLLSLVVFLPVAAQEIQNDVSEVEVPEIRRYTVEVIIFKYAQNVSAGSEVFIPDEIAEEVVLDELAFEEELDLLEEPEEPDPALEEEPEPLPDPEFVLLIEEEFQLEEVIEHLTRIDAYEPLMHFGWTQATWPEEETEAIPLRRFAEPPEGLDGNLTLYLSRYLHLVLDLQLDALPEVEVVSQDGYGDDRRIAGELLGYAEDQQPAPPVRFVIQENRILKNGELRYFDHPKFGVLAMVTRVEEEEEDLDDSGELLGYGPE